MKGENKKMDFADHIIRGRIYQYIYDHARCRARDIRKGVNVANGDMYLHLNWLERHNYIKSKNVKTTTIYWDAGLVFPDRRKYIGDDGFAPPINDAQKMIAATLYTRGSCTVKELSQLTGIAESTIRDNIREMRMDDMVVREKKVK